MPSTLTILEDAPALLIAHERGIDFWTTEGSTPLLTGRSISIAVPDLRGGFLFQEEQAEYGIASPIEWLPAAATTPVVVVDGTDALRLTLVQVVDIDAVPTLVYRKWVETENDCSLDDLECMWASQQEYLIMQDLSGDGERNLGGIESFESDHVELSFGGDVVAFAVNRYEGGGCAGWSPLAGIVAGSPDAWIGEGSTLTGACVAGPTPECPAGTSCDGAVHAAAGPDAGLVAYVFSSRRRDTGEHFAPTLVVHDLVQDVDVLRVDVGEPGVQPTWLAFDGTHAVVGRADTRLPGDDTRVHPILADSTGATLEVALSGRATIWPRAIPEPPASVLAIPGVEGLGPAESGDPVAESLSRLTALFGPPAGDEIPGRWESAEGPWSGSSCC